MHESVLPLPPGPPDRIRGILDLPGEEGRYSAVMAVWPEVYHSLQSVVKQKYGKSAAAVGDEGRYLLSLPSQAISLKHFEPELICPVQVLVYMKSSHSISFYTRDCAEVGCCLSCACPSEGGFAPNIQEQLPDANNWMGKMISSTF